MARSVSPGEQADLDTFTDMTVDDQYDLPDRPHGWHDETYTTFGMRCVKPADRPDLGGSAFIKADNVALVLDGVEDYIEEYGEDPLDIPTTCKAMREDWDAYVGYVSAAAGRNGLQGLDGRRLESAVRFAAGSGRFKSAKLQVIPCGLQPVVVRYGEYDYLVQTDAVQVSSGADVPAGSEQDVPGYDITMCDDHEPLADGATTLFDGLQDVYGVEMAAWCERDGRHHVFETADGVEVSVSGSDLKWLADATTDFSTVAGDDYEYDDPWEESFSASIDDLTHEQGDCPGYKQEPAVAVKPVWKDPRRTSRASLSGRVKLVERYYVADFDADDESLEIDHYDEKVASERPEKNEYSVTSTPSVR